MTIKLKVKIKGMNPLNKLLDALPDAMAKRIVRGALQASAKPIVKQARINVRVKTGNLRDSIGAVKAEKRIERRGDIKVVIGARRFGKKYKGAHAHLVELGTKFALPRPFLEPALRTASRRQHQILIREVAMRTHKEAKKLVAKFGTLR